ncbi:hypothetical protein [Methylosinus sporium]|uniref:Uncharacterized protein n=1 Tax=Methylosinus sporium TaxID=428 RepID=A0A2U1SSN8_METSR|nr:hypothetical protein [Methylosinus sporium]PWB94627.1 hypothetical protein C5689_06075 [Methylosinus sporium]
MTIARAEIDELVAFCRREAEVHDCAFFEEFRDAARRALAIAEKLPGMVEELELLSARDGVVCIDGFFSFSERARELAVARAAGKAEGIEEAAKVIDAAAADARTKADEAMKDCALSPAFAAEAARAPFQAAERALRIAAAAIRALGGK